MKLTPILLVAAVLGAAGFASYNQDKTTVTQPSPVAAQPQGGAPGELPQVGGGDSTALPPNHPPIGNSGGGSAGAASPHGGGGNGNDFAPASDEPASLKWTAPAAWPSMPNPSSMRLATHKVPHAAGDTDDAELSISRAGGETEANIKRWVGMFDNAKEQRRDKTVKGIKVAIVEVEGDYQGGMGAQTGAHKGWMLMGAIVVPAQGQPYFFKVTGPAATVKGARAAFDGMLDSLSGS